MAKIQNKTVGTPVLNAEKSVPNKPVESVPSILAEPKVVAETPKVDPVVKPVSGTNEVPAPVQASPAPAAKPVSKAKVSAQPARKAKAVAKPVKKTTKAVKKVAKPTKPNTMATKKPESVPAFSYDVVAYGAESVELLVESNTALFKGFQKLNETLVSMAQSSFEENSKFAKTLMELDNIQDVFEYQSKYAQDAVTKSLQEGRKISEMTVKLAEDVCVPISTKIEKISGKLAA